MSQTLRNYTKAVYGFDALVQRVPDDRWDADTPCEGWCARDLVAHAVGVMEAVATMARTGEVAMPETPEVGPEPDDVRRLWDTGRDNVLEALDHRGVLHRVGDYWFGEATIEDILAFSVWDPLVHSWDLAQAAGLAPHVSQEVAAASLAVLEPMADGLRAMQLTGDPVAAPSGADTYTRLLAFTGRNPA